ncbi:MAG: hypothetical protein JWN66_1529 [Sphingomonas bacterium]|jgi:hypothetical protein|uniref:hypothetical protein n=1 Tax=Sphingomonas bacterium TaxID=1895847 RepID=UPI00261EB71D|nr:hypothetical protein [Sphingomonas bacterium]MDB5704413.1 hypothetical protein [Sphingomonas bacterium]
MSLATELMRLERLRREAIDVAERSNDISERVIYRLRAAGIAEQIALLDPASIGKDARPPP